MNKVLDQTDWRILDELQRDGRLSFNELARRINLSSPAVAERIRKMKETGVITGYQVCVDPARAGTPLTAFVQLRCDLRRCLMKTSSADEYPEVVELHKLSGAFCTMLKVRATSMSHLEELFERLGTHGETITHIVLSTSYEGRPVEPPPAEPPVAAVHEGWTR